MAFSPDSRQIALTQPDGWTVRFDIASGEIDRRVAANSTPLAFHPDGRRLAVCRNNRIQVSNVETDAVVYALPEHGASLGCFSPDGRFLATYGCPSGAENRAFVWDAATGERLAVLDGHQFTVINVAFSHRGDLAATTSWDGTTRLWDPMSGKQLLTCPGYAVAFSADDRWLAFGYIGGMALGGARRTYHAAGRRSDGASFSPDGRLLASATPDTVPIWDCTTGTELASIPLPGPSLFDPKSGALFTGGPAGLYRWPIDRSGSSQVVRIGPPQRIAQTVDRVHPSFTVSEDGALLALSAAAGQTALIDLCSERYDRRTIADTHTGPALSPDGRWLALGDWHGRGVRVWDVRSAARVCELPTASGAIVRTSPDGRWLLAGCVSEYLLWKMGTWELIRRIPREHEINPSGSGFSPDATLLAISRSASAVSLVDPETGRELLRLAASGPNVRLCFSPDATRLAISVERGSVDVWNLREVRLQLARIGLDWDAAPITDASLSEPAADARRPATPRVDLAAADAPEPALHAELDLGDLVAAHLLQAHNHSKRGRHAQAIAAYRTLLARWPDHAPAANNLAWILLTCPPDSRRPDEALPLALKAVELAPERFEYLNTLGVAYYRLGRFDQAVQALLQASERNPDGPTAWDFFYLAMSHQQLGEADQARDCYVKATQWWNRHPPQSPDQVEELRSIQAEADTIVTDRTVAP
jgi:WD40 repeat protein/Tfp pilus assembly protein PilF